MKALILILLFGYCLTEEKTKTEVQCKCRLRLVGKTLENIKLSGDSIGASDKCDRNDFDVCAKACNQKISNETNDFDLNKPKVGEQQSLGQLYCDSIGADVKEATLVLLVTLECDIEKEVTQQRNGTVVSSGSSVSLSSITRFVESGFKQKLSCVDKKYSNSSTV